MTEIESLFSPDPRKPIAGLPPDPYQWLLIDGGGMVVSSWAVNRDLESPEDRVTYAIRVFMSTLSSLSKLTAEDAKVVLVWDGKDNRAFRRGLHPWYKHGRGSAINRNEVRAVMDSVDDLLKACGVATIGIPGHEADDLVATIAREVDENLDQRCLIFSNDKDYIQLINDNVHLSRRSLDGIVLTPSQCELMGIAFGLDYLHVKALMGDPGDNIKGLRGIGEVKATKIVGAIPDIMDTIRMGDTDLIDWGQLDETTRKAVARAGRHYVSPPKPSAKGLKFAKDFAERKGMFSPSLFDFEESDLLKMAAIEAGKCLDLVEMDRFIPHESLDFAEPDAQVISSALAKLGMDGDEDLLYAIKILAGLEVGRVVSTTAERDPLPTEMF